MAVENFKIENGWYYYFGNGADGERWYRFGKADDLIPNIFGYTDEESPTAKEAIESGILEVSPEGQAYIY